MASGASAVYHEVRQRLRCASCVRGEVPLMPQVALHT